MSQVNGLRTGYSSSEIFCLYLNQSVAPGIVNGVEFAGTDMLARKRYIRAKSKSWVSRKRTTQNAEVAIKSNIHNKQNKQNWQNRQEAEKDRAMETLDQSNKAKDGSQQKERRKTHR